MITHTISGGTYDNQKQNRQGYGHADGNAASFGLGNPFAKRIYYPKNRSFRNGNPVADWLFSRDISMPAVNPR